MMADELLEAGDIDGQAVWKRVLAAVDELLLLRSDLSVIPVLNEVQ